MVIHTSNSSTLEAETGILSSRDSTSHPSPHSSHMPSVLGTKRTCTLKAVRSPKRLKPEAAAA